jgi:putative thiamine transport system permease protein
LVTTVRHLKLLRVEQSVIWSARIFAFSIACLFALVAVLALLCGLEYKEWAALLREPQLPWASFYSLWIGVAATLLSVAITKVLLQFWFFAIGEVTLIRWLPFMLAVPHAALAVGALLWVAPTGWGLRLLSPWLTGFIDPPAWQTAQDPAGLGLLVTLVLKEVVFLTWVLSSHLQRAEIQQRLQQELRVAQSFGYSQHQAWRLVAWPQLLPRLTVPIFAVLSYGMTVVDMAQIIGPQSPPTLSIVAWQWLADVDAAVSAKGAAIAWLLAAMVAIASGFTFITLKLIHLWVRWQIKRMTTSAHAHSLINEWFNRSVWFAFIMAYVLSVLALWVSSFMGAWPFPDFLPRHWTIGAWLQVWESREALLMTLAMGLASSAIALVITLLWLEGLAMRWFSPQADRIFQALLILPLALPGILWVVGVHRLSLMTRLEISWGGVLLGHVLACLPYVMIALRPSYAGFDPRYRELCATFGYSHRRFLWAVKWPLLRPSLLASFAVGFAVSNAQYLATAYIGGGRYSTLITEAVALSSGGARNLLAAYAALIWALPALVFWVAALGGRPRRFVEAA